MFGCAPMESTVCNTPTCSFSWLVCLAGERLSDRVYGNVRGAPSVPVVHLSPCRASGQLGGLMNMHALCRLPAACAVCLSF